MRWRFSHANIVLQKWITAKKVGGYIFLSFCICINLPGCILLTVINRFMTEAVYWMKMVELNILENWFRIEHMVTYFMFAFVWIWTIVRTIPETERTKLFGYQANAAMQSEKYIVVRHEQVESMIVYFG